MERNIVVLCRIWGLKYMSHIYSCCFPYGRCGNWSVLVNFTCMIRTKAPFFPFSSGNLESFISAEPRPIWLMVLLSKVCAQH